MNNFFGSSIPTRMPRSQAFAKFLWFVFGVGGKRILFKNPLQITPMPVVALWPSGSGLISMWSPLA